MLINELMNKNHMTRKELAVKSGVPDSTLRDILNGDARIDRCAIGTLYPISKVLDTTVEDILNDFLGTETRKSEKKPIQVSTTENTSEKLLEYYVFRNCMINAVNNMPGEVYVGVICALGLIDMLFMAEEYRSAFYLLAMIDYQCRVNQLPIVPCYDHFRQLKLAEVVFPMDTIEGVYTPDELDEAIMCDKVDCIPEFQRFGIIETEEYIHRDE